jgi:hypothetical protein
MGVLESNNKHPTMKALNLQLENNLTIDETNFSYWSIRLESLQMKDCVDKLPKGLDSTRVR